MPTPVSSSSPYISASEFLKRYDWRTIGQLLSDDDTGPDLISTLTNSATTEGERLESVLKDASGMVEIACLKGGMYTVADLEALTGNQAAILKRLVSDIAVNLCYQRRPSTNHPMPQQTQVAMNLLDAISQGDKIFGLQAQIDAGHAELKTDTPENVETRNGMTVIAQEFFGIRGKRKLPRR